MHGTAKQRRSGRSLFTWAECWYQPEEVASRSRCCPAEVLWTGWIDPQVPVAALQWSPPARQA